jgi:hypothetical protein
MRYALLLALMAAVAPQRLMDELHDALKTNDIPTAVAKYEEAVRLDPSFLDGGVLANIASHLLDRNPLMPPPPPPPPGTKPPRSLRNDPSLRDVAKRVVALAREATKSAPDDYFLAASLADLQRELGDLTAARATAERYATAHPDELRALLLRTTIGPKEADFDAAIRVLDAAAASSKGDAQALYTAGVAGYEIVAYGSVPPAPRARITGAARKLLELAVAAKPDSIEAMTYLNLVLRQQARDEADPAKQKALMDEADRVRSKAIEMIKKRRP